VRKYIAEQEKHHCKKSFREELVEMLGKAGIPEIPGVSGIGGFLELTDTPWGCGCFCFPFPVASPCSATG
jgi:hypothetical protein